MQPRWLAVLLSLLQTEDGLKIPPVGGLGHWWSFSLLWRMKRRESPVGREVRLSLRIKWVTDDTAQVLVCGSGTHLEATAASEGTEGCAGAERVQRVSGKPASWGMWELLCHIKTNGFLLWPHAAGREGRERKIILLHYYFSIYLPGCLGSWLQHTGCLLGYGGSFLAAHGFSSCGLGAQ